MKLGDRVKVEAKLRRTWSTSSGNRERNDEMKPMLASNAEISKLKYPVIIQPKIDGVRALNISGRLCGRSLKSFANRHTTEVFSRPEFAGLDGEMIAGEDPTADGLCRATTSALNSILGEPEVTWWIFDSHGPMNYQMRYADAVLRVGRLSDPRIRIVPQKLAWCREDILEAEEQFTSEGYEGLIIRDPQGSYKEGRSTVKEGGLLRIKRWEDSEMIVDRVEEGRHNANVATTNALGHTERSTHQENMIPNGQVGRLIGRDLKTGQEVTTSPGKLTKAERIFYFEQQQEILGRIAKYKFFPTGGKDKPRMPTWQGWRMREDL